MSTATQQDDDLLIIADDTSSGENTDTIEFSFNTEEDTVTTDGEAPVDTEETIIDLSSEEDQSMDISIQETPVVSEVIVEEKPELNMGISFDMDSSSSTEVSSTQEETQLSEDFSFNLGLDEKTEKTLETTPIVESVASSPISTPIVSLTQETSEESLNDILAGTIAKLDARKETIATDKAAKTSKEEELKVKIKELQDEVKELEADMKSLDAESDKITVNISELEKMKLDPVKEHNARRVVKK